MGERSPELATFPEREVPEEEWDRFKTYLRNLDLTEDMLHEKKILDIGAGDRLFSAHLLREGVTDDAYSLDPVVYKRAYHRKVWAKLDPDLQEKVSARTVQAVKEAIPVQSESMDYALVECMDKKSYGINFEEDSVYPYYLQKISDSFDEYVRILKPGGELRLYALPRSGGEAEKKFREAVENKLAELRKKKFAIIVKEADRRHLQDGSIAINDRLIIRKPR